MSLPMIAAISSFALQAGSSVLGFVGQNQAASANRDAANIDHARDTDALNRRQVELDQIDTENAVDTAIASLQAEGQIAASATARGLAGPSVVQALNASMFGVARDVTAEHITDQNQRLGIARSREDADVRRQSRINQVPRGSVVRLALGLGNAALSGYNTYNASGGGRPKGGGEQDG